MSRPVRRALPLIALCTAVLALGACGSSNSDGGAAATVDNGAGGQRGGTLSLLTSQDIQSLDPGVTYGSLDLNLLASAVRPLYAYAPDNPTDIVPDLAASAPQVSPDGKTLTVRIRSGVKFGPPVNREVTSRDVKYAIERGFNPNVANAYASTYYGDVVGADRATGGPIAGIETPDDQTIVFELTRPTASLLAQATVLPLSAPVPPEYAKPFDAKSPSTYGNHLVSSGPYMVSADRDGNVLGNGYVPGRSLRLVRNPNWSASTDARPAYLNEVDFRIGGSPTVSGRQVLAGDGLVLGDSPTPALVKKAYQTARDQIFFSPGAGIALRRAQHGDRAVRRREPAQGASRPRSTASRCGASAAARSSATSPPTSSTRACSASRRQAGSRAPASTSSRTRRATERWPRDT